MDIDKYIWWNLDIDRKASILMNDVRHETRFTQWATREGIANERVFLANKVDEDLEDALNEGLEF